MLLSGHSIPFTLRFCFSMKKCPISGKLVSLPTLTSPLCTPALTLQADVLEASSGYWFFFKRAMQSKATPPNRLPECISSSGNSCPQPSLCQITVNSLITWRKAAFTRRNTHLPESESQPPFENLLQHGANMQFLTFFLISACLSNCSQLGTLLVCSFLWF